MEFSEIAKIQYYGQRPFEGQEEAQLEKALALHHRLMFGVDPNLKMHIPPAAPGKYDLWKSQIESYLTKDRIDYLRNNLQAIAGAVHNHREQLVTFISKRLKGEKVASVTRGVYEGIISGQHMFLYGTAGVGKTTLVELLCRQMRLPYARIDGQTDMADIHMMGGFLPVNGSLRWTPSGLMMAGNVILLVDELPRIPASVSNVLLQPMAERSMAFSDLADGGMREVDLSPGFTVIGTGNPFHYGGMAQKNEAVFDRFGMGFDMPHPEHASRIEMLQNRDNYPNSQGGRDVVFKLIAAKTTEELETVTTALKNAHRAELGNAGSSLLVVALEDKYLRIRLFGSDGRVEVDKREHELNSGSALKNLKALLNSTPFPDEATFDEEKKQQVIENAMSTSGLNLGIPGLTLEGKPLTLLDLHASVRLVKMQNQVGNPDWNRERLIRISEMVSPAEYRKRVGWTETRNDEQDPDARIRRGALGGNNNGPAILKRFVTKFDELLESVVQEGSNPRGEEMMDQVARVSALASGRDEVNDDDLRVAAQRCLRFRLKPYPGQEESLAELIRIAAAFWTQDSTIYGVHDHSVSEGTWKALGIKKNGPEVQHIFG